MKEKIYNSVVVRFIEHRNVGARCNVPLPNRRGKMNQRGATFIMVAVSMLVIFGFAVLAIDVSMMLLARTQLKNAADSAALAGASVLALDDTATGRATEEAIRFAGYNVAIQEGMSSVAIVDTDVTFPEENMITVHTHRTVDTKDPVSLFFLRVMNLARDSTSDNKGNVEARSSARVSGVCATDCVKPWCPPDRWDDRDGDGVFDWWDVNKNGVYDPPADSGEWYDWSETGYMPSKDLGTQIVLQLNNSPKWQEKWYYAIDYPPINKGTPNTGGDWYREYIAGCEPQLIEIGDYVRLEPGGKVGPTKQGLESLIKLDPTAEWGGDDVINSAFAVSPRIVKLCLFDPMFEVRKDKDVDGKEFSYVKIAKIMVIFIEGYNENADITGWFIKLATQGESCDKESFMYKVALVPGPEEE